MAAEQAGDFPAAAVLYETLSKNKPEEPDTVLLGLARSLAASGNRERALEVYRDLYYGYPMSDVAAEARTQMIALGAAAATDDARELARAEQLFTARRYADAQAAFEALPARSGDDRELVALRIAECHHYLGRHRQAVAGLQPYLSGAKREAEARFFHLSSTRALGDHAAYVAAATRAGLRLQDGRVDGRDAEQPGHALHRHRRRSRPRATVFADYLERFPQGKYGARAAWRLGWWKYRAADFEGAAAIFDQAAVNFPRSDYRPSWLYWAGRAYAKVNQTPRANARFELVRTDYLHSYYGRLAGVHLGAANASRSPVGAQRRGRRRRRPPACRRTRPRSGS